MGMLLAATALLALAFYLKVQGHALASYIDGERGRSIPERAVRARVRDPRHRPRHIRTGRLARLGYRHHRERADRAFA
jgi:hypothetical protein